MHNAFRLQKRAIRVIVGVNTGDTCRGYVIARGLTEAAIYIFNVVSFFYANFHLLVPFTMDDVYGMHYCPFRVPAHSQVIFENSCLFAFIKILNH